MSRELYKRVSPHLQRVLADGGTAPSNMSDLFLLQQSNEKYKDVLKLAFCPELYGNNIRTYNGVNYIQKSYSVNSIQQELGIDFNPTGQIVNISGSSSASVSWGNVSTGKLYKLVIDGYTSAIGANVRYSGPSGWSVITGREIIFTANLDGGISFFNVGSSSYTFTPHLYEVFPKDLTQTSSSNQPILDKIAPAEKLSAKNPNGGSNYLTHTAISFGASDEWTSETMLNWNGTNTVNFPEELFGKLGEGAFRLQRDGIFRFVFLSSNLSTNTQFGTYSTLKLIGRNKVITLVAKQNTLKIYVDGIYVDSLSSVNTNLSINEILGGRDANSNTKCTLYSHHIFSKALSATEITERSSILKSIFPEIPFTRIGDQIWSVRNFEAVVTPQGNIIPEMQDNGNVEKITNAADRDFSSDTGFWSKDTGITIADGVCHMNTTANNWLSRGGHLPGGAYKVILTITNYVSGIFKTAFDGANNPQFTANGTYTFYIYNPTTMTPRFGTASSFIGDINDISIQKVGWSDSQNLYEYIYNNTSGTDEQKTYAAVKAAAMWCHYNNDPTHGAIYGKLYNWFAVKLLQMDIDYYNAANPSTPWGWRVPTQADFNTLVTTLGGTSVAGGKIKMTGTTYWNSPNTGATNESGFSLLACGRRLSDGAFGIINVSTKIRGIDCFLQGADFYNQTIMTNTDIEPVFGYPIRLIKA